MTGSTTKLSCPRCRCTFLSASGLNHHQTYSTKCIVNYTYHDIICNLQQKSRTALCNLFEGSGSLLILDSMEPNANDIIRSLLMAVVSALMDAGNIMMNAEYIQNDCNTAPIPSDVVNECGRHLYITPSFHNSEIFELKENKYYPWINEHEFWITEWLLMKANISQKAANELLLYIHKNGGNMAKMHI